MQPPTTKPLQPQAQVDWVRLVDARGRTYYYNNRTATSSWEQPANFREPTPRTAKSIQAKGVVPPEVVHGTKAAPGGSTGVKRPVSPSNEATGQPPAKQGGLRGVMHSLTSALVKDKSSSSSSRHSNASPPNVPAPSSSSSAAASAAALQAGNKGSAIDARRHWGRPDRARTEDFPEEPPPSAPVPVQEQEKYRFRTSSSADLVALLHLTREQYLQQQQQKRSYAAPAAKRSDTTLHRPPSFLEMDVRTASTAALRFNAGNSTNPTIPSSLGANAASRIVKANSKEQIVVSSSSSSSKPPSSSYRPRRNTTNSILLDTLMSKPDAMFQIRVIAWLLHAHMIRFALARKKNMARSSPLAQKRYEVFNEDYGKPLLSGAQQQQQQQQQAQGGPGSFSGGAATSSSMSSSGEGVPSAGELRRIPSIHTAGGLERQLLMRNASSHQMMKRTDSKVDVFEQSAGPRVPDKETIAAFITAIFTKSQMESECVLMVLVYIERLLEATRGTLELTMRNWQPITLACMILASKVWDDLSMWNADFSLISGGSYDVKRINELEIALLECMQYNVRVPASTYAKYYFQLRSLRKQLGEGTAEALAPLRMDKASKLELLSERYQGTLGVNWSGPSPKKTSETKPAPSGSTSSNSTSASHPAPAASAASTSSAASAASATKLLNQQHTRLGIRKRSNTLSEGSTREILEEMHNRGPIFASTKIPNASLEQVTHLKHSLQRDDVFY